MSSQIACQMYTLREFTKTAEAIASTLKRVKQIGYDAVQLSALGPIDAKELANILEGEGLVCCATHTSTERMTNEPEKLIDELRLWKCQYTAIGGFWPKGDVTVGTWSDFAIEYNLFAKKLGDAGISIGYHNHSHELVKYDGTPALQILIDKLDHDVWFEIDTYWITHGGGDPAQWIDKVKGRIPCVHLKDMAIGRDKVQYMAEVGVGNLNWKRILETCRAAGTKWYIIEQDTCYRDPFDSLETSLKNLKEMGVE